MQPFISFYTPTYKRPKQLAACLESVAAQTLVNEIEQIVIVDHVGVGVGGMFERIQQYADAVHGQYVHVLADDDVLASPDVVEQVKAIAVDNNYPPVIIVGVIKGGMPYPLTNVGPPVCGCIDLGCFIIRSDVWKQHVESYGNQYEGDYAMGRALWDAGHQFVYANRLLFLRGAVSRGAAEAA